MDLRDIFIRLGDSPSPRLERLANREMLDRMRYQSGTVRRPNLPNSNDIPVKQANLVTSGLLGPKTDFEYGVAETDGSQGWYEVPIDKDFQGNVTVIAVAEHRSGQFQETSYNPPEHDYPAMSFESEVPSVEDNMESNFKSRSRDIGMELYDAGESAFDNLPLGAEEMIDAWGSILDETFGASNNDNSGEGAVESIFGALGSLVGGTIEDGLGTKASEIKQAGSDADFELFAYHSNVSNSYSDLSGEAEAAINDSPQLLFESLGIPGDSRPAPVAIRNVDSSSFEFLGYGEKEDSGSSETAEEAASQPPRFDYDDGGEGEPDFGDKDLEFDPMKVHYVVIGETGRGIGNLFG